MVLFSPPPLDDLSTEEFLHLLAIQGVRISRCSRRDHPRIVGCGAMVGRTSRTDDVVPCSLLGSITVIAHCPLKVHPPCTEQRPNHDHVARAIHPHTHPRHDRRASTAFPEPWLTSIQQSWYPPTTSPSRFVRYPGRLGLRRRGGSRVAPLPQKEWLFFLGVLLCVIGVAMVAIKPAVTKRPPNLHRPNRRRLRQRT